MLGKGIREANHGRDPYKVFNDLTTFRLLNIGCCTHDVFLT